MRFSIIIAAAALASTAALAGTAQAQAPSATAAQPPNPSVAATAAHSQWDQFLTAIIGEWSDGKYYYYIFSRSPEAGLTLAMELPGFAKPSFDTLVWTQAEQSGAVFGVRRSLSSNYKGGVWRVKNNSLVQLMEYKVPGGIGLKHSFEILDANRLKTTWSVRKGRTWTDTPGLLTRVQKAKEGATYAAVAAHLQAGETKRLQDERAAKAAAKAERQSTGGGFMSGLYGVLTAANEVMAGEVAASQDRLEATLAREGVFDIYRGERLPGQAPVAKTSSESASQERASSSTGSLADAPSMVTAYWKCDATTGPKGGKSTIHFSQIGAVEQPKFGPVPAMSTIQKNWLNYLQQSGIAYEGHNIKPSCTVLSYTGMDEAEAKSAEHERAMSKYNNVEPVSYTPEP